MALSLVLVGCGATVLCAYRQEEAGMETGGLGGVSYRKQLLAFAMFFL